jgi:RNA polymerase sigma-70 factor (ECF subfamily)
MPMPNPPDDEGEPSPDGTFEAFYRRHFKALVASGIARGLNQQEAEDDAQEAMIRIYRNWSTLHPQARTAYARKTTLHNTIDRLRKAARWRKRITEVGPRVRTTEADTSGHTGALDLLRRRLTGPQLKVMFLLYTGLSVADIATCLELSPSTVRSHAHNARKSLRKDDHG